MVSHVTRHNLHLCILGAIKLTMDDTPGGCSITGCSQPVLENSFHLSNIWAPSVILCVNNTAGTPLRASVSSINITVVDSNDNAPAFLSPLYSVTLPEGLVQTTQQVLAVNATDADSGSNGKITYSITGEVSVNIRIDPVTVSDSSIFHYPIRDIGIIVLWTNVNQWKCASGQSEFP